MELKEIEGVGEATAKRLITAGFTNVETIAVTPARELKKRAGYQQLAPAVRIVEAARQLLGSRFMTAWEHWQLTKKRALSKANAMLY